MGDEARTARNHSQLPEGFSSDGCAQPHLVADGGAIGDGADAAHFDPSIAVPVIAIEKVFLYWPDSASVRHEQIQKAVIVIITPITATAVLKW